MRCTFCPRQAVNEFKGAGLFFCDSCGKAFREGFEKGRIYECAYRRRYGAGRKKSRAVADRPTKEESHVA